MRRLLAVVGVLAITGAAFWLGRRSATPVAPAPRTSPPIDPALDARFRVELPETHRLRLVPFASGLPHKGQWRNGYDLADLDGDHHLDVVFGPARKGAPHPNVWLGDGHGAFRAWTEARFPPLPYDYGAALAIDLDGDGDRDLVLAAHLRELSVLQNQGGGRFERMGPPLVMTAPDDRPIVFSSRALAAIAVGGKPAVVALSDGPSLGGEARTMAQGVALLAQKDGAPALRLLVPGAPNFGDSIATGDLDGDGRADVVTASGQLGFDRIWLHDDSDGAFSARPLEGLRARALVRAVAVADFDGDGHADVALGYTSQEAGAWHTGIDVVRMSADGARRQPIQGSAGRAEIYALAAGDLDHDGARDLVAVLGDGTVALYLGDGHGGFSRDASLAVPPGRAGCRAYAVRLGDLDEDGTEDVVAAFAGEGEVEGGGACASGGAIDAIRVVR